MRVLSSVPRAQTENQTRSLRWAVAVMGYPRFAGVSDYARALSHPPATPSAPQSSGFANPLPCPRNGRENPRRFRFLAKSSAASIARRLIRTVNAEAVVSRGLRVAVPSRPAAKDAATEPDEALRCRPGIPSRDQRGSHDGRRIPRLRSDEPGLHAPVVQRRQALPDARDERVVDLPQGHAFSF